MDGSKSSIRDLGSAVSQAFDLLSPISRLDESDFNDLAPLNLNLQKPSYLLSDSCETSNTKHRRRCSEIVISSPAQRNGHQNHVAGAEDFSTFRSSHWLSALFEWIFVTFTEKKHQEYVLREIVQCLNELGVIPLNISITSEQLVHIQRVIDNLKLRIWQEHSRPSTKLPQPDSHNEQLLARRGSYSAPVMKHSLTFSGASLAKLGMTSRPTSIKPLPFLPLAALFPAGRFNNDFVEQGQLGRGGFGVVIKAVNCFDGTAYAVKKVFVKQVVSHDHLLRALREVRAASSLNHPNIVRYYSAWIESMEEEQGKNSLIATGSSIDSDVESSVENDFTCDNNNNNLYRITSESTISDEFDINHQLRVEFAKRKPNSYPSKGQNISSSNSKNNGDDTEDDGDIFFYDDSETSKSKHSNIVFKIEDSDDEPEECPLSRSKRATINENRLVPVSSGRRQLPSSDCNLRHSRNPTKACLFIQMELCTLGTLSDIFSRRNNRALSMSSSSLPSPLSLPSSPNSNSGFDVGSPSSQTWSTTESLVNVSWNASVFLQIVRGLAYVHSKGVIHRDLKPANIFLTGCSLNCPEVKLGDFGLTRFDVFSDRGDHTSLAQADLRRYSERRRYSTEVGTRAYASPEQVTRFVYTRQSDLYSLGLILYELYRPFKTTMERLSHFETIRNDGPDDLDVSVGYPETWQLIKRLTAQNPIKRPNCTDLLAELETNEVDRLREVVEQQKREIERLRQAIVVDSPSSSSRFSPSSCR